MKNYEQSFILNTTSIKLNTHKAIHAILGRAIACISFVNSHTKVKRYKRVWHLLKYRASRQLSSRV